MYRTDEKLIARYKKNPYKTRFKVPTPLQHTLIPPDRHYKPWTPSPHSLLHLAESVTNNLPMPDCWNWNVTDVAKWLRNTVGLPRYNDCFVKNFINGRNLLLVDASVCPRIGITDFTHIQLVTAAIRKLFHIEKPKFDRNISLPPRYPWTCYLLYRVLSGPMRERTKPTELYRKIGIIDAEKSCPFGHWEMIKPNYDDFPYNRFGLVKRKNVYLREEHVREPRGHSYYKRSFTKSNYFIRTDVK